MHMFLHTFKLSATFIFIVIICVACDQKYNGAQNSPTNSDYTKVAASPLTPRVDAAIASDIADSLWLKSQEHLNITYAKANDLQEAISRLLENPDENSLLFAQQEWQSTMIAYEKLSPLLYLEHVKTESKKGLDKEKTSPDNSLSLAATNLTMGAVDTGKHYSNNVLDLDESRNKIAAWPIQPGYLDSFGPHIHSGIVNDITLLMEPHTLRKQHLMTDSEEVTLGLYAIEYLLFGDKDYKNKNNTNFKRFINVANLPEPLAQAGLIIGELPTNRRRALIELQSRLLVNDIKMLISLYQTNGALMTAFKKLSAFEKLHAFKRSVTLSLQKNQALLTYFDEDLPSAEANSASDISDNTDQKIVDNADTDAFSKRFIFNRTLALKNNLATIKSLFLNAKTYQKTAEEPFEQTVQRITEASTLADALLADEDKKVLAELLEGIEKEIAESNYSIKSVVDRLKAVVSILSV
ncbi:MAG: hypothetical protein ACI97H_001053 [Marinobacter psychrophilus]|jgi:hypothetical protein